MTRFHRLAAACGLLAALAACGPNDYVLQDAINAGAPSATPVILAPL